MEHSIAGGIPLARIRDIEHKQIFGRRTRLHWMGLAMGEFKVVLQAIRAEHDAIESFVILETGNDLQAKASAIHCL